MADDKYYTPIYEQIEMYNCDKYFKEIFNEFHEQKCLKIRRKITHSVKYHHLFHEAIS